MARNELDGRIRSRLRSHSAVDRQWACAHPDLAQCTHLHRAHHQYRRGDIFGFANADNYVRFFLYAGLVIIGAGIFDMVDGRVARQTDQVTVFGAFFDSVIDRYSDVVLFFGLLVFYARGNRFFYVVLTAFVMVTSLMVSYTRARSEALIRSCKVGFMERPERVVLIILGALGARWGVMAPALWVLAVLSTITVIHRIAYTYSITKKMPRGKLSEVSEPAAPISKPAELLTASHTPRA
jgi:phosphatidylglycerophosphate synthase